MVHGLAVLTRNRVTENSSSIQSLPPDDRRASRVMGPDEKIEVDAGFFRNLRHSHRVAKDVCLPRGPDVVPKFLLAVFLSVEELAYERFTIHNVSVPLDPGGSDRNKTAGFGLLDHS